MLNSWDKVRTFLDTMGIADSQSSPPFSSKSSLSSTSADSNQHPLAVGPSNWLVGEETIKQILSVIQPMKDSETRRKEIIEYLQNLIADTLGIKVFPFGSVPLKTYLPHGDVDLTMITHYGTSNDLAAEIFTLLKNEEQNNSNILVRDVLCVPAQVQVVKCTVGDIAVDISFNQTAGLSALYFLEQVDQFIGKDHIFKLSVILIKAWCFYESRLLGGFHGLIATYALEIMILHVINLFHSSLHCPLAVLYKFLEYYSTFDWEKYCIGINGLVLISSLPELEVVPLCDCDDLLLTDEFLKSSREALSPMARAFGTKSPVFPIKFLNILDPLRDENNLGRSVSKGNFYRIKSALSYGAQRLCDILMSSPEKIIVGLETFFSNTLERNGKGNRVDILAPVPPYGSRSSAAKHDNNDILAGIEYGLWFDDYDTVSTVAPATTTNFHGWTNGWGEVGPFYQYDYNAYAYYDMEESPPSSLDSPTVPGNHTFSQRHQINNPILEERWNSNGAPPSIDSPRGIRPNNLAFNEEKWKLRRTVSAVDNPRINRQNSGGCYEEKWNSNGSHSPAYYRNKLGLNTSASFEDKPKSRGTCAYIPHHHLIEPNRIFEQDQVKWENRKEECEKEVNFAVEEFPVLPGSKPIPIGASPLPSMKYEQVKPSTSLDSTESSSETGNQLDSDGSISPNVFSEPTVGIEVVDEDKTSSKSEEKMVDTEPPLQLTDECEFPPLYRPEKPVVLCKKEYPPLRACLWSQKKNKSKNYSQQRRW